MGLAKMKHVTVNSNYHLDQKLLDIIKFIRKSFLDYKYKKVRYLQSYYIPIIINSGFINLDFNVLR